MQEDVDEFLKVPLHLLLPSWKSAVSAGGCTMQTRAWACAADGLDLQRGMEGPHSRSGAWASQHLRGAEQRAPISAEQSPEAQAEGSRSFLGGKQPFLCPLLQLSEPAAPSRHDFPAMPGPAACTHGKPLRWGRQPWRNQSPGCGPAWPASLLPGSPEGAPKPGPDTQPSHRSSTLLVPLPLISNQKTSSGNERT